MSQTDLKIKISVEAQLQQLRAMEAQFAKQIVQLRALGDTGSDNLKSLERNLGLVRGQLDGIGRGNKVAAALGDMVKDIPVVGAGMQALNGTALPTALIFGAATTAVAQFAAAMNFADQLQDTSEQLNVSSSSLQALNAHFGDAGVKAPQVTQTLLKLTQSLAEAAAGSEPLLKAFAALNLSVDVLRALSPDEAMVQMGRAMLDHADASVAAAAAQDILGRGTGKLANALKDLGAQGLDKVKDSMIENGRVLDDELVKRLADANQKLEAFGQRWTIFKASIAAGLLPSDGPTISRADAATRARNQSPASVPLESRPLTPVLSESEITRRTQGRMSDELRAQLQARLRAQNMEAQLANAPILAARAAAEATAAAKEREAMAAADATAQATQLRPILEAQALLDAKMLQQHTARLDVAGQIMVTEEALARVRSRMPAEDDASVAAAKLRLELGTESLALDERLFALRAQQAAADKAAQAEDEAWLERTYAADAERITARAKAREQEREQELSKQLGAGAAALLLLDQSKFLLNAKRDEEKLKVLQEQRNAVAQRIALLEREQAMNPTPERQGQIDGLRAQDGVVGGQMSSLQPVSVGEGAKAGLFEYLNSIPDAAARAQQSIYGIAQALEGGIASSLTGLINQTMTWTQALANIGQAVIQAVLQSFVRMVAQWITQQIIMAVAGKAIQAAQIAALAPIALASAALWAPAATAASIATFGGAAISGAAMAKTAILTSAIGFATGGAVAGPGTGTSDSILARLSNGEHVIDAATVARMGGHDFFNELRAGKVPALASAPAAGAAGGGGESGAPNVSMHQAFYFDREEAMRSALNSPAGRRMFVDMLRGSTSEL